MMTIPFHARFDRHGLIFSPLCPAIRTANSGELESLFSRVLERYRALRPARVVFDLTAVKRLDKGGIRCLLHARRQSEQVLGVACAVAAPSPIVLRQIKGWDGAGTLRVWPTLHAALACLRAPDTGPNGSYTTRMDPSYTEAHKTTSRTIVGA